MSALAESLTQPMTPDEFLAWEAGEDLRYEFDGFKPIAMTGGTANHHAIVGNLRRALERQLPPGCRVSSDTFKLGIGPKFRYPDAMVVCHSVPGTATTTDNAVFVAEVVSPSSVHTDRVEKLGDHARVPGLVSYFVVDPAARVVTLYRKVGANLVAAANLDDSLDVGQGLRLEVPALFAGVA